MNMIQRKSVIAFVVGMLFAGGIVVRADEAREEEHAAEVGERASVFERISKVLYEEICKANVTLSEPERLLLIVRFADVAEGTVSKLDSLARDWFGAIMKTGKRFDSYVKNLVRLEEVQGGIDVGDDTSRDASELASKLKKKIENDEMVFGLTVRIFRAKIEEVGNDENNKKINPKVAAALAGAGVIALTGLTLVSLWLKEMYDVRKHNKIAIGIVLRLLYHQGIINSDGTEIKWLALEKLDFKKKLSEKADNKTVLKGFSDIYIEQVELGINTFRLYFKGTKIKEKPQKTGIRSLIKFIRLGHCSGNSKNSQYTFKSETMRVRVESFYKFLRDRAGKKNDLKFYTELDEEYKQCSTKKLKKHKTFEPAIVDEKVEFTGLQKLLDRKKDKKTKHNHEIKKLKKRSKLLKRKEAQRALKEINDGDDGGDNA